MDNRSGSVRHVTLLLGRNGSLILVPENSSDEAPSLAGLASLLVATFAGGLLANGLLAAALLSSVNGGGNSAGDSPGLGAAGASAPSRARSAQALLCVANALDCLVNVPSAATLVSSWGALVSRTPYIAALLCRLSAVTSQLTASLQTLTVLVLVLDSCLQVFPESSSLAPNFIEPKSTLRRLASAASWTILWVSGPLAVALTAPVAILSSVRYFPTRYGCGGVRLKGDGVGVGASVLVLGYLVPWAGAAGGVSLAVRHVAHLRWRRKQLEVVALQQGRVNAMPVQGTSFSALNFSTADASLGHLSAEDYRTITLASVLLLLYTAMMVPGILTAQAFQLARVSPPPAPGPESLWPVLTGTYETIFVWLRFQFAVVSPGMILVFNPPARKRVYEMLQWICKLCCCCCMRRYRYNSVAHSGGPTSIPLAYQVNSRLIKPNRYSNKRSTSKDLWINSTSGEQLSNSGGSSTEISPSTAVLFATTQGLHLRTLDPDMQCEILGANEDADDVSTSVSDGRRPGNRDSHPRFVFHFCDLATIEDSTKTLQSPDTSTAPARSLNKDRLNGMLQAVGECEEDGPSLTREELQESLRPARSMSSSYKKNVRFASVVSEIPLNKFADQSSDKLSTSGQLKESSGRRSAIHSPVKFISAQPRTKLRSLEMTLVSNDDSSSGVPSEDSFSKSKTISSIQ